MAQSEIDPLIPGGVAMTTILEPRPTTVDEIQQAVTALAPLVGARAAEVETARRLPADLLDDLVAAGAFRVLLPGSHGGAGADPAAAMEVYETLSRADASVGWSVMIGSGVFRDLVGLPRATFDALYRDGPDVLIAGVFNPTGVAVAVDGGYRVSGRWAFASGCPHSDWLYGNCIEQREGADPAVRTVLVPAGEARIEDTWHVIGLRGTGSHHFTLDNVVVPTAHTCAAFEDEPVIDAPIVGIPVPALFAMAIASVAIGTARGALDEIMAVATSRTPLLASTRTAADPFFQHDLATADTELRAARALMLEIAGNAWEMASAGDELTLEERARIRAAAVWAVSRSTAAVSAAYHAGGGSTLYGDSPLQRRLRDIHAMRQHFLVRPDTLKTAGAILAGQQVEISVF
jgi:indole-3-acetate monooxygenase